MRKYILLCIIGFLAPTLGACSEDSSNAPRPNAGPDASVDPTSPAPDGSTSDGSGSTADGATSTPPTANIQLLDISDWHGQLDPIVERDSSGLNQSYGGVPILSSYFKALRAQNPNTLVVTGGDAFGATPPASNLFDDQPAVKSLNYLGVVADTFGNHNFDRGTAALKTLIDLAEYKYVSTNLTNVTAELGDKVAKGYYMVDVGQSGPKVRVAFLGITSSDAPTLILPGRMGAITVEEPVAAANKAAADARAAGAHVVVALVHMGGTAKDNNGNVTGPLIDFANGVSGVDVVLGDHTDMIVNTTIKGALVVENRSKGRTFAKVDINVQKGAVATKSAAIVDPYGVYYVKPTCAGDAGADAGSCTCGSSGATCQDNTYTCSTAVAGACEKTVIAPDPDAVLLLKPYKDQSAQLLSAKIGEISTQFTRNGTLERTAEVPIGDLLADAALDRYKNVGAQIAFVNGGGIRDSLPAAFAPSDMTLRRPAGSGAYAAGPPYDLTKGDIFSVLPFGNTCVVRKITGQVLWQVLERSVSSAPASFGGFLQIAGFKFTYKTSLAAGSRVQSVTLNTGNVSIPSNDTTEYTLVTSDFTNAGGDGYTMLKESSPSAARDIMADVFLDYVQSHTPITTPTSGRITVVP